MWTTDILLGFSWYDRGMKIVAIVEMLINDKGQPGVRITADNEFNDLYPIERVGLLVAAVQLCGAAISAIVAENPDDESDIRELLDTVSIYPEDQALN